MAKSQVFRKPYRIKKKKSIFRSKFLWLTILILIIFGGIFYLLYLSPYFQIKEIKISGNEKVPTEKILSPVQKEIGQKLLFFSTKSIFLVNLSQIKKGILDNFPQIAEVEIKRRLPSSLGIDVSERQGIANFCQEEQCFLLDGEGVIFEEVPKENLSAPLIKKLGEAGPLPKLGGEVIEKELLSKILEITSELKNLGIPSTEVLIVSDDRLNVKTQENWEIYFNPQGDVSWQLTKLKAVLEKFIPSEKRKDLEYVELRFGNSAPYKYRQ